MVRAVDALEVVVVVDNYADVLLPSKNGTVRAPSGADGQVFTDTLLAEHGLCLLLKVRRGDRTSSVLLDAGYSPIAAPRNLERLGESLDDVEALILSHGHEDHTGAMRELLRRIGGKRLVVHPEAFHTPRYFQADDGVRYRVPELPSRDALRNEGINVIESRQPTLVCDGTVLVTGEIPRRTAFEHGLPGAVLEREGQLVHDAVLDDQAIVVDVQGHGLVVISGCAHAGIVNTVLYARETTNQRPIYAVLGGFHLTGAAFRAAIPQTIEAIQEERPACVIPMHCTGVDAAARFRYAFGEACLISAVGTRFCFPPSIAAAGNS